MSHIINIQYLKIWKLWSNKRNGFEIRLGRKIKEENIIPVNMSDKGQTAVENTDIKSMF
jgi:hypothetical protein